MSKISDEQVLAALRDTGGNVAQAARALGLGRSTVRDRRDKLEHSGKITPAPLSLGFIESVPDEPQVVFSDKVKGTVNWEAALERHGNLAAARREEELQQKRATLDLSAHTSPVCIMLMSDVHIGSAQCDTEALIRHIKYLKNIPNLYTIIHGDLMEFAISQRMLDAVLGQTGSPQEQARVYQSILTDLGSKVLAVISGNHDERSARMSGIDVVEFLLRAVKNHGVYLRDGGTIAIKGPGKQTYYWSAMHGDGLKGHSMYSNTAASASHARFRTGWHDIHSSGHTHEPEVKVTYEPRANGAPKEPSVLLKAGSYKTKGSESFVDRMGLTGPEETIMPAVILFPGEKRVIPFLRVEDALPVLEALSKPVYNKAKAEVKKCNG
jgi:transposase-like protein